MFLQPTDNEEIGYIISSLNSNKASGPNSISYRIFLLKNEISKQLADFFNLFFMTGAFPSVLKTAKVVPAFKKDSKLDYSNYRPIPCYQILKKYLNKLCTWNYILSLFKNIICDLQFEFKQQYSTSHILINITENIWKAFDDENIGCRVFVDLQKAFDTIDHQILTAKLKNWITMGFVEFQMIGISCAYLIAINMYL